MLYCLQWKKELKGILKNESQLDLDQISDDLVEFFNRTFYSTNLPTMNSSAIDEVFIDKLKQFESSVIEPLRSRNYYIVRDQFCLSPPLINPAWPILDKMFEGVSPSFFAKNAYIFMPLFDLEIELTLILNEETPEFDCSSTKPECLNDCLTAKIRLSKLFYNGNESGIIYFDYKNATAHRDFERGCFEKCEKNLCLISKTSYYLGGDETVRLKVRVVRSSHSISTFNYWVQMAGMMFAFFRFSIHDLAFKPFEILNENRKKLILASKMLITLLCLVAFLLLSTKVIGDFITEREDFSYKTSRKYLSTPENLNLVLCVPVIHALNRFNDTENPTDLLSDQVKQMNFSELESKTDDAFAETINEIYLETLGRRSEVSYRLVDKVMFTNRESFTRCFQVLVDLNEPRYRSFLQASKLKITMKHYNYSLYLLPEGQTFHSSSQQHHNLNKYEKKISSRRHELCRDYPAEQREGRLKCVSLENCVDQCAQVESIKQGRNISAYNLIDKQLFTADQWSSRFPDFSDEAQQEYDQMKTKCRNDLIQDCDEILFKELYTRLDNDFVSDEIELKISYTIETTQYDAPSDLAVIFDLLTVEGIFNLNAHHLLITVVLYFKTKFHLKSRNVLLLPIHLLCAAGFTLHIWTLFDQVRNDGLLETKHIKQVNTKRIPEMLFCFDFDQALIDQNVELTGNYLEEITRNMTIESLFSTIAYLNPENDWKLLNESNFRTDERVSIDTLYYFGMKCFRIALNVQYEFRQFYFDVDLEFEGYYQVLKVYFNESAVRGVYKIVLFTKTPDKLYLSEPIPVGIIAGYNNDKNYLRQNSNEVKNEDKFFFLRADSYRSLSSLFPERDVHGYLANLKAKFKRRHNATTIELPLEREEFGLKINDTLFREFYEETQRPKDQQLPTDFIYSRQVFDNSFSEVLQNYLGFSIQFDEETLEFRNKNNVAKFVLQLCNAFGLWLSLKIFSLFALDFKLFRGASWKRRDWAFFSTRMKRSNPELSTNIWTVSSIKENLTSLQVDGERSIDATEVNFKSTGIRRKSL